MKKRIKILLVTDQEELRQNFESFLDQQEFDLLVTQNPLDCLRIISKEEVELVFLDLSYLGSDTLSVIKNIKRYNPNIVIITIADQENIDLAIETLKNGAYDFINAPLQKDKLLRLIYKAAERYQVLSEITRLREEIESRYGLKNVIGKSKAMQEVLDLVKKAASIPYPVLIQGEPGTGKELIAKVIHYNSPRRYKKFIRVNVAKLDENLLEHFLFGRAPEGLAELSQTRSGAFLMAHEGTLFLDEIAEMSPRLQDKLLKVLQEKEITPLGSKEPIKVDVRIISASTKDLQQAVEEGTFREDLYYRLSVINIHLPPLRERKEDIPLLALHFLKRYSEEAGREIKGFTPMAMELLLNYHWPGNVRELENVIQSAVYIETGDYISTKSLNHDGRFSSLPRGLTFSEEGIIPYAEAKKRFEREYILRALEICGGNVSLVARKTGIIRTNLYKKFKKLNIDPRQIPRRRPKKT